MKSALNIAYFLLANLLISATSAAQLANNAIKNNKNKEPEMSVIERNKEVVRKLYEQCLNKRSMGLLQDIISTDYIGVQREKGPAGFEKPVAALMTAFPDVRWNIEELIGEGGKVVVKQTLQGTHTGQFQHIKATGKAVANSGMVIYELKDGKIISSGILTDRLGFLQELGVLPVDLTLVPNKKAYKDRVSFIDKFFVPSAAKNAFYERMSINRNFIKNLAGFIEDAAYEYTDANGNLICVTVALWENREALNKAKEAVQAEYKKQGFDVAAMFKSLNIVADRGIYTELEDH